MSKLNEAIVLAYNKGYRVSDDGRLLNKLGSELKGGFDTSGYRIFGVRHIRSRATSNVRVHRLRAYQTFGDEIFKDGIECRHLDGNKLNNSKSNIAIGTHSENMMDKTPTERSKHAAMASSSNRALSDEKLAELKEYHAIHRSYKKTMEKFGISSKGTLNYMLKKQYVTSSATTRLKLK